MIRNVFVILHRWVGLAMTLFLVIVGLTGGILAFRMEIDHIFAPNLFATPRPGVPPLDLATLAERVEALARPNMRLTAVTIHGSDQAQADFLPPIRRNPQTGKAIPPLDPKTGKPDMKALEAFRPEQVLVDPWTGAELGRRKLGGDWSEGLSNFVPFVFFLHWTLTPIVPMFGRLILGVVAVAWTIDCFVGFYLTLPVARSGFWRKWKPAFVIKRGAGAYRLNFDLHRASGLWLWAMLFIFAWSSTMFNMRSVFDPVMATLFDYDTKAERNAVFRTEMKARMSSPKSQPALDWRGALAVGEKLMAEQASRRGFTVIESKSLGYLVDAGIYSYGVRSDLGDLEPDVRVTFDGDTGALIDQIAPPERLGNKIEAWLKALHTASVFGLPYKIFVCALGLVVAMLSITGVYIWWTKRKARRFRKAQGGGTGGAREPMTVE